MYKNELRVNMPDDWQFRSDETMYIEQIEKMLNKVPYMGLKVVVDEDEVSKELFEDVDYKVTVFKGDKDISGRIPRLQLAAYFVAVIVGYMKGL